MMKSKIVPLVRQLSSIPGRPQYKILHRKYKKYGSSLSLSFSRTYINPVKVANLNSPRFNKNIDPTVLLDGTQSQSHKLISNKDLRSSYVSILQSMPAEQITTQQITAIFTNLDNLIDVASGFPDPTTIALIFDIWKAIYAMDAHNSPQVQELQLRQLQLKDKLIHMIINTRNYSLYESHIAPLYKQKNLQLEKSWADQLVSTYALQYDKVTGEVRVNRSAIVSYLKGDSEASLKRKFISILIHAGVLNSTNVEERFFFYGLFLDLVRYIENDSNFLFLGPKYDVYTRVVKLMGLPYKLTFLEHTARLAELFESDSASYHNFITSAMHRLNDTSPNSTLNFWKYKLDICEERGLRYRDILHFTDLTSAMTALCNFKLHKEVLELYSSYSDLHNEDQIEILLRVSEETKDWRLLQSQFEDMYGRGNLPYIEHYVVVMRALSSISAGDQIDLLFAQLKKRNLVPNALIFSSLISSRLHDNDLDGAKGFYGQYLEYVSRGLISPAKSPELYSLIFKIHFKSSDLDSAMQLLQTTCEQQLKQENVKLLDSKTLAKLIELAARNYGLAEVRQIKEITRKLGLESAQSYKSLAKAYISLDQYELAEQAIYYAHMNSNVPFTDADIYAVQLRNYRLWAASLPKSEQKSHLHTKQTFIAELVQIKRNEVINATTGSLIYREIIQYYLNRNKMEEASKVLLLAKSREVLSEVHFLPILNYLAQKATYESYTEVLAMYRRMAKERIQISTRTYVPLMKALIFLDRQGQTGGANSFKLLKSIFEMNGLSLTNSTPDSTLSADVMFESSVDLCEIVSAYVESTSDESNNQLLVNFFNQMKMILGKRLSNKFKFSVYKEMSKVYNDQENSELASTLIATGLGHLDRILKKYKAQYPLSGDVIVPTTLMKNYRRLIKLKLELLEKSSTRQEYAELLESATSNGVVLAGQQYNKIFQALFQGLEEKSLHLILGNCEENLISGNWVDVKLMRIYQQLYKFAILHVANVYGDQETLSKYKLLNEYYNTTDFASLRHEVKGGPFEALTKSFNENRTSLQAYTWTPDKIIEEIPEFFNPERRINTRSKISPPNCYQLWLAINTYAEGNINKAFELMDRYPQTIEFLMYNDVARVRKSFFRAAIDQLVTPRFNLREGFQERKDRTIEALTMQRSE